VEINLKVLRFFFEFKKNNKIFQRKPSILILDLYLTVYKYNPIL
jgi:hypothetical protein